MPTTPHHLLVLPGLTVLSRRIFSITSPGNSVRLTSLCLHRSSILIFFKVGGLRAPFQTSGTVPSCYDLSKVMESGLPRTSASSLGIPGCNPSRPVDLRTPSHTALLPTSLPLPQQQALLDGQTACKTLPSAQLGQALPVINPSARIHRHRGLGSAAACCMLSSNSPWRSPDSLSARHTPCREMASPLGAHPSYRPQRPWLTTSPACHSHPPSASRHAHGLSRNSPALPGGPIDNHTLTQFGKDP